MSILKLASVIFVAQCAFCASLDSDDSIFVFGTDESPVAYNLEELLPEVKQSNGLCLSEHNSARQQNGKGALAFDSKLEAAARRHNDVMVSQNCFSHQCNGEPSLGDRVTQAGYRWRGVAENIAAGQSDCRSVMQSWMNSSGHRANILGNYRHVGCARKECASGCSYKVYWTCVFGTPM